MAEAEAVNRKKDNCNYIKQGRPKHQGLYKQRKNLIWNFFFFFEESFK